MKQLKIERNGAEVLAPVIISEEKIAEGVIRVARQIESWAKREDGDQLQIISILNGAQPFTRDICIQLAQMGLSYDVHEIKVSSTIGDAVTGRARLESGSLVFEKLAKRRVLIVDDIIDTCATIFSVLEMIKKIDPAEVRVAAVVNKYASRSEVAHFKVCDLALGPSPLRTKDGREVDYWLFGYGMDLAGKYRDFNCVGWVEVEKNGNV
jgi:hypoxanthine phosphoribosyltransferase